ncbi:MAG: hypothetical protein O2923_05755 [Verrucomicrobia bacterium]|nr:hypothetical protein [Verrucomicrobiota bacterium]MDA1085856.1 hypothetical protein [Verrucomicrobiota bacterium]
MQSRISISLLLLLLVGAAHAQEFEPVANVEADTILTLIEQLGADAWDQREQASSNLLHKGETDRDLVITQLVGTYLVHQDPEVRYRARSLLRAMVDKYLFQQKKGFLGVSLQQITIPKTVDGQSVHPIAIRQVLPGHPAIAHGVKQNELIVKVDGRYTHQEKFPLNAVISYIKTRGPGSEVTLRLMSEKGEVRDVKIPLGARPVDQNEPPIEEQQRRFFRDWLKEQISASRGS